MTNIGDVYNFLNFITDKVRDGYISPSEASSALDGGQQALFKHYKPLKELGDDEADTALVPFKRAIPLTSTNSGVLSLPADYSNAESIYADKFNTKLTFTTVLHEELQPALEAMLYPIEKFPRFIEESDGIHLYPVRKHDVDFHYLSKPDTPVIGGTVVGNSFVFDPLTSVELQFSNEYWFSIIQLSTPYIGINLSSPELTSLYSLFTGQTTPGDGNN